jgi:hypothetical protein
MLYIGKYRDPIGVVPSCEPARELPRDRMIIGATSTDVFVIWLALYHDMGVNPGDKLDSGNGQLV